MSPSSNPQINLSASAGNCTPRWGRRPALRSRDCRVSSNNPEPESLRWCNAALALLAGLLLRIWMLHRFPQSLSGDSLIYGTLAKNLLLHGQFALTDSSGILYSTLIRLPGYPLLLALVFRIFGIENYFAVTAVQIALDLVSCLLLAGFVHHLTHSSAAARATLWLAALCPFTAIYAAAPLTETSTLFAISLALWAGIRFIHNLQDRAGEDGESPDCAGQGCPSQDWLNALLFTIGVTWAALLRPDGALVAVAFAPAVIWGALRTLKPTRITRLRFARMGLICTLLALAPFAAWTIRNWQTFHVFQPLAPRYANDPSESTFPGWQRWVKTWCLDFVSTAQIYWNVPDGPLDAAQLPSRAVDSPAQQAATNELVNDYNQSQQITPQLDAHFAHLADERIAAHPLRSHLWLPLGRVADMWLRPRVENLPVDLDWWVYAHHSAETRIGWAYASLNLIYLLLGLIGLCLKPRLWPAMLAYFLLRSALLATIEAPEARYTLECFPMLFALGGIALSRGLEFITIQRQRIFNRQHEQ